MRSCILSAVPRSELLGLFYMIYAGMNGVAAGWPGACLIGAFVAVFINMVIRTKEKLDQLAEKKGERTQRMTRKHFSLMVSAGLLVNSIALLGADHLPNTARIAMAVVALFLILVGTFKTVTGKC